MQLLHRWIGLIVLATIIACALILTSGASSAETEPAPQVQVPSGIGALGRIEPHSRVVDVSHDAGPEGARIAVLHVEEGSIIKKGDVIATFSDHERKQAKLQAANARVPMVEARIKAERANEQFFLRDYKRMSELVKTSAVSKARFDDALRNYQQSQASVAALQAELASAKADAELAAKELLQSELLSPMDATVLKINAWPGERVGDSGVVQLADLREIDVVAEIYERDMPRVSMGQKAEIMVPGMKQRFSGTVRELGYMVRKNDLNDTDPLADRDNRVVEVRIGLDGETSQALKHLIFMQVDVRLL